MKIDYSSVCTVNDKNEIQLELVSFVFKSILIISNW